MKYSLVLVSKFFNPLFLFQRANKQLSILLGYYIAIQALNYHHSYISKQLSPPPQAVPARKTWRRPLMVRQPYSVAVPSTGGRLHPLVPEGREAW